MNITRRHLQIGLGSLWLLDGALQCQPSMFSSAFPQQVLAPAAEGQPSFIAGPMHVAASLVTHFPVLTGISFAVIQILLGLGILARRFTRIALAASIVWSLAVWFVGEGLGGLATGATLLMGAPGAALIYALIAVVAWPALDGRSDTRPSWMALPAWSALWITGAVLQLISGNNSSMSVTMMLRMAQSSAPGWIGGIDHYVAGWRIPVWVPGAIVALNLLIAIWALLPGWTRQLSIGLGVITSLASWLLFQGLGNFTSGLSTDPNSGPLMVLLAVAVVGAYARDKEPLRLVSEEVRTTLPYEHSVSATR